MKVRLQKETQALKFCKVPVKKPSASGAGAESRRKNAREKAGDGQPSAIRYTMERSRVP